MYHRGLGEVPLVTSVYSPIEFRRASLHVFLDLRCISEDWVQFGGLTHGLRVT